MSRLTTYNDFKKAHAAPAPPRAVTISAATGAKVRQSLGLPPDAPVEELSRALDKLGAQAKVQRPITTTLVSVPRRGSR